MNSFENFMYTAIAKGVNLQKDPILKQIYQSKSIQAQITMKEKARIILTDSFQLMGVIDPYGILKEGEIFVQIRK